MKNIIIFISVIVILVMAYAGLKVINPPTDTTQSFVDSANMKATQSTQQLTKNVQKSTENNLKRQESVQGKSQQDHQSNVTEHSLTENSRTTAFDTNQYSELFHSADVYDLLQQRQGDKTAQSIEHEMSLQQTFLDWQQEHQKFRVLRLEIAECDANACFVSLAGIEQLTEKQLQQLEDELLFNKNKFSSITATGTGGTYGIYDDGVSKHFRLLYVTGEQFNAIR